MPESFSGRKDYMQDFFNLKVIKNTRFYWVYIITLIITFIFWWILAIRLPISNYIPYWFWQITTSPRTDWWLFFPLLALSIGVILIMKKNPPGAASILILIAAGVIIQHTFGLLEGRGLDAIRNATIETGHAVFATQAVTKLPFLLIAGSYDDLILNHSLPHYPNATKPPGQLLFYMVNERGARFLPGEWDSPLEKLATFMALLWPILASLPVIFIYLLSREVHEKSESSIIASLLYIFTPALILIPLHLDQSLYPLLFVFTLFIFVCGIRRKNLFLIFISGLVTGITMFVSFSLIAIPFYILIVLMIKIGAILLSKKQSPASMIRESIQIALVYVLGVFLLEASLFFNLSYNVIENYQFVMSNHFSSKIQVWSLQTTLAMGGLNVLEYALWTGVPLFGLTIIYGFRSFKKIMTGNSDLSLIMGVATLILFFVLAFFGKTVAETARLWIFLTPLVVIFSAKEIVNMFRERTWNTVTFLIVLQMITTFSLKMWQDF
jgi:hypothetical protein